MMEIFIFCAGLIMVLIVSSGLAISLLFLGDMNPHNRFNRENRERQRQKETTESLKSSIDNGR